MTIKQLQYIVTVAEEGNITAAAKKLFIAQPSLTTAIRDLEAEYNITIFMRSNKGIKLTSEGEEFLGYARQVLEQAKLIDERYMGKESGMQNWAHIEDAEFVYYRKWCSYRVGVDSLTKNPNGDNYIVNMEPHAWEFAIKSHIFLL